MCPAARAVPRPAEVRPGSRPRPRREAGIARSMGWAGDAYDNAPGESFFAPPECELIRRRPLRAAAEARREVFGFIEGFHDARWLHSAPGYEWGRPTTRGSMRPETGRRCAPRASRGHTRWVCGKQHRR